MSFRLALILYLVPADDRHVVLPFHKMSAAIRDRRRKRQVELRHFRADANRLVSHLARKAIPIDSPFLQITSDEIILTGPARARLLAHGDDRCSLEFHDDHVAEISLQQPESTATIVLRPYFMRTSEEDDEVSAWTYVPENIRQQIESAPD